MGIYYQKSESFDAVDLAQVAQFFFRRNDNAFRVLLRNKSSAGMKSARNGREKTRVEVLIGYRTAFIVARDDRYRFIP